MAYWKYFKKSLVKDHNSYKVARHQTKFSGVFERKENRVSLCYLFSLVLSKSPRGVYKKAVRKNTVNLNGIHPRWSLFSVKCRGVSYNIERSSRNVTKRKTWMVQLEVKRKSILFLCICIMYVYMYIIFNVVLRFFDSR